MYKKVKYMDFLVTAEQMKNAESNAVQRGLPLLNLAQNAAAACFNYISRTAAPIREKKFVILCGKGMNGGDGLLLAALLKEDGGEVLCVFAGDIPNTGLAKEIYSRYAPNLTTASYSGNEDNIKHTLQKSQVIIDCVFGTGFSGKLDYKINELFGFINTACCGIKFSVDLPSGVDSNSGRRAQNSFIPHTTLILGAFKKSLLSHPARDYCGDYALMDIGLTAQDFTKFEGRFTDSSILVCRPKRYRTSHKGTHGRLLNIAGSEQYIGAALLSSKAAVKSGTGIVTLAAPKNVVFSVAGTIPEAVFFHMEYGLKSLLPQLQSTDAVAVGCGLGNSKNSRKIVDFVLKNADCPIILDADGINSISDNINILQTLSVLPASPDSKNATAIPRLVLTPHPAEFSRITGLTVAEIQSNRVDYSRNFAKKFKVIVVLKGVNTVIAAPDGRVAVNTTGNAGLAKAGTGDVLTGIIASLAAQGTPLFEAAVLGVYLHGLTADELAQTIPLSRITASDIAENIP